MSPVEVNKKAWIIGILILVMLIAIFLLRKKEFTETRFLMNTVCEIKVIGRIRPKKAIAKAFQAMQRIDSLASFEGSGEIARINRGEEIELSQEVIEIIKEGVRLGYLTNGAFDITIRPLMELWGDFKTQEVPHPDEIKEILPLIDYRGVDVNHHKKGRCESPDPHETKKPENHGVTFKNPEMKLDLSGIAKGYAVDLAVEHLKSAGVHTGLVNAGGDIKVFGDRVWKIGIKNPRGQEIVKVLRLKNQAVATSGDYEKYFILNGVRYHHILAPHTGLPASECISVTIIAANTSFADALATGVFVLGPEKGISLLDSLKIPGLIITPDLNFLRSKELM